MALYVVSTPIGNLEDITFRAVRILKESGLILAEDTRRARKLLSAYGIAGKLKPYHDHNKERITPGIISILKDGIPIALVSDSGTPGVSDPGFYLVRACVNSHIPVIPVPGPTAAIAALVASGLPTDKFFFHGFFPKKEKKARAVAEGIIKGATHIFYESPHRMEKTLKLLAEIMPEAKLAVGRELTKKFEEFLRGSPKEILDAKKSWKGEVVLLISV